MTSPLGNFKIARPLDYIFVHDDILEFQYIPQDPPPYGLMEFSLDYNIHHPYSSVPFPPLELGESNLYLSGGLDFFNIPRLSEGYGYASFDTATAEFVPSVDFRPVPEPSTYALGGVAFIALALWKRHAGARSRVHRPA